MSNSPSQTASNLASEAANRVSSGAKGAIDTLDASRHHVATGIEKTADAVRNYAPDSVVKPARTTADAMESAAGYIRTRDLREMGSDLTEAVRRNPAPSLIAAVAVGFLLGLVIRRD